MKLSRLKILIKGLTTVFITALIIWLHPTEPSINDLITQKFSFLKETLTALEGSQGPNLTGSLVATVRLSDKKSSRMVLDESSWKKSVVKLLEDIPKSAELVEICLPIKNSGVFVKSFDLDKRILYRGLQGLKLEVGRIEQTICPNEMHARNTSFNQEVRNFIWSHGLNKSDQKKIRFSDFSAVILIIDLKNKRVANYNRTGEIIPLGQVNEKSTKQLLEGMGVWFESQIRDSGKIEYACLPSLGVHSKDNNVIRQYMASLTLNKWSLYRNSKNLTAKIEKNLRFNKSEYFKTKNGSAGVWFKGDAKLGGIALAALAYSFSNNPKHQKISKKLFVTTLKMQKDSGRFRTFLDSKKDKNHNFYPGEALYLWAHMYSRSKDEKLLKRIYKSIEYYMNWHQQNPHPAFIPWHTQAYYKIWQITKDKTLKQYIFKMNDWLIDNMHGHKTELENQGEFYNPQSVKHGLPHSASVGVYLEGLIDAYTLAKNINDHKRAEKYKNGILRGIRYLMQMQYNNNWKETYNLKNPSKVIGGLRSSPFDNTIRIDNVQHSMMALIKILKSDIFEFQVN